MAKDEKPAENSEVEKTEEAEQSTETNAEQPQPTKPEKAKDERVAFKDRLKSFVATKKGKIVLAVSGVVLLLVVLLGIPFTRYAILGSFVKRSVVVIATDATTSKPVTELEITIGGASGKTDTTGKAVLNNVPVGFYELLAKKKYYIDTTQKVEIGLFGSLDFSVQLKATGRQVPITVLNKISQKPVTDALVTAADTAVTTDQNGEATIVVPADKTTVAATIKAEGYNDSTAEIAVTEQKSDKNKLAIAPSGKVYFLSKRTGKVDVMKSDLDGANAQLVLAGTGKEQDDDTTLLASRDWKYLALKTKRDDKVKLYLIDTSNDKLSVMDEGDATFQPVGWYNEYFIFTVRRNNVKEWEPKQSALKSFKASTGQLVTIDETAAEGTTLYDYLAQRIGGVYILDNLLVYVKQWDAFNQYHPGLPSKKMEIVTVEPSGTNKKVVKDFPDGQSVYINARLYKPNEIYYAVVNGSSNQYFEFEDGHLATAADVNDGNFYGEYPTYLVSPQGDKTLWSESRDGKNVLFVGDKNGENGKEVATLRDFRPYGWFTNDYLLISKNLSELFILPVDNSAGADPLKISDYHRLQYPLYGYGYGYGGF